MDNPPDIVELSRERLKSLFRDNSLKQNAIETIIGSFNSCTSLNERNGIAARVSPALRDELLQEVFKRIKYPEQFEKLARVIPFLLSSMTKNLDLNILDSQKSYDYVRLPYIDEVLYMASHLAPNIERLYYTTGIILNDRDIAAKYALLSILVYNFRHLQILEVIDFTADLHDLVFLCGHLPSLRVLKLSSIQYVFSPSTGEEISKLLCNLRLLVVEDMEMSRQAIGIIGQYVPNLDIVTDLKHTRLTFDDFLHPVGDPNLSQRKIVTFDRSWFEHPDAEIHERHPNVTHLQVQGDDAIGFILANLSLPNFTKVSSILVKSRNEEIAAFLMQLTEKFLQLYGENLRSLSLELGNASYVEYDIEQLLNFCPNIESLSLNGLNGDPSPLELDNAPHLKEISWEMYGFLPNVFLLPQVQKLELTEMYPGVLEEDCVKFVSTLIADKDILQELEILRIDFELGDLSVLAFRNIAQLMKNASAFLPKLIDLRMSCDRCEYVALARRMKESERFKANFFSNQEFDNDIPGVFVDEQLIDTLALYQNHY